MALESLFEHADDTIRPQDDLFGHVNGRWLETAEIPADLSRTGGFIDLRLEAEADVGDILREASAAAADGSAGPGSDAPEDRRPLRQLHGRGPRRSPGGRPAGRRPGRHRRRSPTSSELVGLLGRLQRDGLSAAPIEQLRRHRRPPLRPLHRQHRAGRASGCPTSRYYREDTFAEIRAAYVDHVAAMLGLVGWSEADAADGAAAVMALETRLAAGHWDRVRNRDVIETYNLTTLDELRTAAPGVRLVGLARRPRAAPDRRSPRCWSASPATSPAMSAALTEVPLDDWKVWLTFHLVHDAAPVPEQPVRRGELRLLLADADRRRGDARSLEARRRPVRRRRSARRSAPSTSPACSRPRPRPRWTSWWPTWSRPTASASAGSSG